MEFLTYELINQKTKTKQNTNKQTDMIYTIKMLS